MVFLLVGIRNPLAACGCEFGLMNWEVTFEPVARASDGGADILNRG